MNGTSHASASALAADTPTSRAPTRPGPVGGRHGVDLAALAVDGAVRQPGLDERLGDDRAR